MHTLEDLEHFAQDGHNSIAQASVREVKAALERLVVKMDGLEAGFDKIAERSCECFSSSRNVLFLDDTFYQIYFSIVEFAVG